MESLRAAECCELSAVYDPVPEAANAALSLSSASRAHESFEELLEEDLDGVVIATPSALHAEQCIKALQAGKSVFCQKPLARTQQETRRVVEAARQADRRLAIDFSYRHLAGMQELKRAIEQGALGQLFSVDLIFHNAYGPDKPWFYQFASSGGGCVMDLGIHLVDLALWLLPPGEVDSLSARLFRKGVPLSARPTEVEDFARASFRLGQTDVSLSCSWGLHAGRDAIIEAAFYGTAGGARLTNVNGSFFDFELQRFIGTSSEKIAGYPDDWGGRALIAWARALEKDAAFDPEVEGVVRVAEVIDGIYQR